MTVPQHDDSECLGLDLLVGLAVPLWLVGEDGLVVWLNTAAGNLMDQPALSPHTVVRVKADATANAVLARCRDSGHPDRATIALQAGDRVRIDDLDVRVTRAPSRLSATDRPLLLLEGTVDRAARQEAARQSHARLLDAIESVAEGFVLFDAEDRLVLCNQHYRDLFSDCRDELTPGTLFEPLLRETSAHGLYHLSPEEMNGWVEQRLELHRNGGPAMEVQLRNGRWMRIEERRTSEGGTVGVRTDITDLKHRALELAAARDAAEQANRQKSDYVHHLSHDLRTPLNAVMGFAQILRDEVMGPLTNPRYREAASQIVTAGDYMLELINNLLDLARIEAGKMELYEEASDLNCLIDVTFAMMAARADAVGVTLDCDVEPNLPYLYGDPTLIRQMLTNLVGNALKFTPPGGRITVMAHRNGDGTLSLSVRDTGRGMTAEQIPLALTAFSQAHDRMTTNEAGTGLGLPLTCAQVALHGGRLDIDSAPGHGTTVRLTFPADRVGVGVEERA